MRDDSQGVGFKNTHNRARQMCGNEREYVAIKLYHNSISLDKLFVYAPSESCVGTAAILRGENHDCMADMMR